MNDDTLPDPSNGARTPSRDLSNGPGAADERMVFAPFSDVKEHNLSGVTIGGCQLLRKLAEGGMGEVYEALQVKLGRKVAIKVLTDQLARRPEFQVRFEREARAAAALNHPNVVQVYDFGEESGKHYLIMELVEGEDLSVRVMREGKMPVAAAMEAVEQAARALKAACAKAIIHRDIKPANLLITRDGRVKVSDLGLAKILTEATEVTATNVGIGSPHFLAPEQADDAKKVDHRADIYSLGITLLYLLTGKRPFEGSSAFSVVMAHANRPLPTGRELGTDLPEPIEGLIQRMTAKLPADRYPDYDSLLEDIERVKEGFAPELKLPPQKASRNPLLIGVVVVVLLAIVVAGVLMSRRPAQTGQQASAGKTNAAPVVQPAPAGVDTSATVPDPGEGKGEPRRPAFSGAKGGPLVQRGGTLTLPLPRPHIPEMTPLKNGPLDKMMAEADAYAKTNSKAPPKIIDRYHQIQVMGAGTKWEAEAGQKVEAWHLTHALMIQEAIDKIMIQMQPLMDAREPLKAFELWKDFPAELYTQEADQMIRQQMQPLLPPGVRLTPVMQQGPP